MKKLSVFILSFCFVESCYSFNWEKCKRIMFKETGGGWSTKIVSGITNHGISSAQFTTSTGECSAIRMSDKEEQKHYLLSNVDKVKKDSAKGDGEYLSTFLEIMNCPQIEKSKVKIKKSFEYLFKEEINEDNYESFYQKIDNICYDYSDYVFEK
jgi:hypothetical protein